MQYLNFDKVVVKNFQTIGNVPVEWNICDAKHTLIRGANGHGKTTLFQALTFGLFGRAYAKIKKSSLVNEINGKGTEVEVYFNINGDNYKVVRKIKPDDFKIYKNDVLEQQDTNVTDYQEYLEKKILKMDFKSYSQMVMLASIGYTPFLELKASDRRQFVESFLNIDVFTQLNKELKKDIDINNKELSEYSLKVNSSKSQIKILEEFINNINTVVVDTSQQQIQVITEAIKTMYDEYKKIESEVLSLESYSPKFSQGRYDEINKLISQHNSTVFSNNSRQDAIRKSIKFFDDNPKCPQCDQTVDLQHKQKHVDTFNNELYSLQESTSKAKGLIDNLTVELNILKRDKTEDDKIKSELNTKKSKMSWLAGELKSKYNNKKQLEEAKPKAQVDNTALLMEKQSQLEALRQQLDSDTEELELCLTKKAYYDKMLTSLKDSGAKAEIINEYVPIITDRVNRTIEAMNMYVKFDMDGEFNESIKSRHRDAREYESYSIGERMRINIALLWAWKELAKERTGVSTNLLAIDEILENVDVNGFEDFIKLVESDPSLHCVIISHKTGIETMFEKVINVKKIKGFSQLTVE